jgi:hypothetical protein
MRGVLGRMQKDKRFVTTIGLLSFFGQGGKRDSYFFSRVIRNGLFLLLLRILSENPENWIPSLSPLT